MTRVPSLLADWGTTRLRLYLCSAEGESGPRLVASVSGPGVKFDAHFEQVFLEHAARLPPHGPLDVVITGMIGSNIGWHETGYVPCPANWQDYVAAARSFAVRNYRISILPGVSCENAFGYRDIMRGEEVQVLGALRAGAIDETRHLVCLPGTHSKWVLVENRSLDAFATSMPGELFDVLSSHSVLVPPGARGQHPRLPVASHAFDQGVELLRANAELALAQALFAVRCRQVSGELAADDALSCLSGVIVAADIRDVGLPLVRQHAVERPVTVIGDPQLAALYVRALSAFGVPGHPLDAEQCTLSGLDACRRLLAAEVPDAT